MTIGGIAITTSVVLLRINSLRIKTVNQDMEGLRPIRIQGILHKAIKKVLFGCGVYQKKVKYNLINK